MGPGSDIRAVTFEDAATVTPSDTTDQYATHPAAGFICSSAGTVKLKTARGSQVTLTVLGGYEYHLSWSRIYAGGTSAGTIVALLAHPYEGAP